MIRVEKITIDPIETAAPQFEVSSYKEADAALAHLSINAPKNGGYHKCDFTVEFEDGNKYHGRYDLKHYELELPNLRNHIRDFVNLVAGFEKPEWVTEEKEEMWAEVRKQDEEDGSAELYREFAAKYDVGVRLDCPTSSHYDLSSTHEPCAVCGKGVKNWKHKVIFDPTDDTILPPAAYASIPEEDWDEMGADAPYSAPIGSDCLRRHPELKPYLVR
jgi:hypothetical protein